MAITPEMMVWRWAGWELLWFYRGLERYCELQEDNAHWARKWSEKLHSVAKAEALAECGDQLGHHALFRRVRL